MSNLQSRHGSQEYFVEQAASHRRFAKKDLFAALATAGISGALFEQSVAKYADGGQQNIYIGGVCTVLAIGSAILAYGDTNSALEQTAEAQRYEQLALQTNTETSSS